MEGIETIRALRRAYPDLKIIAMSGGGRLRPEGYLEMAKAFGAVSTLSKPFESAELHAAIAAALSSQ
jgi:CheY-like chemotaxis protein